VSYQGGKTRIASAIVDHLLPIDGNLYDLCCGCGAISIEAVNKGVPVDRIVMVDVGPWGMFWKAIGDGSFDVARFEEQVAAVPADPPAIPGYMKALFSRPCGNDAPYVFPLLQAATFGGAQVWIENGMWGKGGGWRSFWSPTATSNRRSVVNPMMPMPVTLLKRVKELAVGMRGVRVIHGDVRKLTLNGAKDTIYIDPPYTGTTGYYDSFDAISLARSFRRAFVSEGFPVTDGDYFKIESNRKKGGMNGKRQRAHEEWLNEIRGVA
jgi:hypothetical protein